MAHVQIRKSKNDVISPLSKNPSLLSSSSFPPSFFPLLLPFILSSFFPSVLPSFRAESAQTLWLFMLLGEFQVANGGNIFTKPTTKTSLETLSLLQLPQPTHDISLLELAVRRDRREVRAAVHRHEYLALQSGAIHSYRRQNQLSDSVTLFQCVAEDCDAGMRIRDFRHSS